MKNEKIPFTYPTEQEIKAANAVCCGRNCKMCESPTEYAWRKRDVDMCELLRIAMAEQLSDTERKTLELHWFDGISIAEIARRIDINSSAVSRTLDRAERKLHSALRLAVLYQHNLETQPELVPAAVERAAAIEASRRSRPRNFCEEIRKQRTVRNLSRSRAEKFIGLGKGRLAQLENGTSQPKIDEILMLAAFFGVTTDELLKGENE